MTEIEQKRVFSRNLTSLLEDRHVTQREVADSIGVSPQTFNTWCKGVAIPRMEKIQRLADYFQVNKTALIDPPNKTASSAANLTVSEQSLLDNFRQLNDSGQRKAAEYVEDLAGNEKYTADQGSGDRSAPASEETA